MGSFRFSDGTKQASYVNDIEYVDVSTEDFSPSEDASLSVEDYGKYLLTGFLVRPQADGNIYGITKQQYDDNDKSVTGLTPQLVTGAANNWVEVRFVKIYAGDDSTYPTTCTDLNIGILH